MSGTLGNGHDPTNSLFLDAIQTQVDHSCFGAHHEELRMGTNGIITGITRQDWLEPAEERLQKLLHATFASGGRGGQKIKNVLHGTWLGHPLHVILTDVPIGAWTGALVFDFLELSSGRKEFAAAADASITLGLIGAAGAAITGLTDWQDVDPPARRVGLVHGLLNLMGTSLFLASRVMRKRRSRSSGRRLAILGYTVATAAAYLGGNLVYEQQIGVDHTSGEKLPEDFETVLPESDLPDGKLKRADYNGVPILLVRRGKRIFALAETCSHLGGPLAEGKLSGNSVQCPWHGSRFALEDGRVLDGPAVHPQPCLESRIRNGKIEVRKITDTAIAKPSSSIEDSEPPKRQSKKGGKKTGTTG
jgi:nitrite reductase/ring-hydroxylating ferredoxin subunit/uncharacterized membrane protein